MKPSVVTCLTLALAACEVIPKENVARDSAKADSVRAESAAATGQGGPAAGVLDTGAAASALDSLTDSLAWSSTDTLRPPPVDSVSGATGAPGDSVQIFPRQPRRGGVIVALARSVRGEPRCRWRGERIPCFESPAGARALIPLPADDSARSGDLVIQGEGSTARRTIGVEDRQFGRELVMLDSARWARVRRRADIARDARAIRQVLAGVSTEQRWEGRWRDPAQGVPRSSGYGVERFYARASDSSRAITLEPSMRARGIFATDTSSRLSEGELPSWRHAGVDIPLSARAAVRAAAAGTVADVGSYVLTGRTVLVDHGQGVYTAYFHLDTALVRRGDVVRQGATLGRVGSSGLATGPHLHYGVYIGGRDVDPAEWRRAAEWLASVR